MQMDHKIDLPVPKAVLDSIPNGETRLIGRLTLTAKGEGIRAKKGTYDQPTYEVYAKKDSKGRVSFSERLVSRIRGDDEQATGSFELD